MKKTLLTLALIITALFTFTLTINAEEIIEDPSIDITVEADEHVEQKKQKKSLDPEEHFQRFVHKLIEHYDAKVAEATTNFESKLEEKMARINERMETINTYAPEMSALYSTGYNEHLNVHTTLFSTHLSLRNDALNATINGLSALNETLIPLMEEGEMTNKEVIDTFRAYAQEQRAYNKAIKDQYKADIANLDEANEANKVIVTELKAQLEAAIEAEDVETANVIITQLYDYLMTHIEYDYSKLNILEAVSY